MNWRCFTCEHVNQPSWAECEACGTGRNFYAEENVELKDRINTLEVQISTLRETRQKVENDNRVLTEKNTKLNRNQQDLEKKKVEIKIKDAKITKSDSIIRRQKKINYFFRISAIMACLIFINKYVYLPYLESNYISKTNQAFSKYLDSLSINECISENFGARQTFVNDINHDGKLDGVVIANFNGIDCKNIFTSVIYAYSLENNTFFLANGIELSRTNERYFSFHSIENDTMVFNYWDLKKYNQKNYNKEELKSSYAKVHIYAPNDTTLIFSPF